MINTIPYLVRNTQYDVDGKGPTHILINADNEDALTALQETHKNSVDVIYIDPPYNTGTNEFAYRDRWETEDWKSFLRPRLLLAHSLLKETGVIMVSLDVSPKNTPAMWDMLNEIFGHQNFVAQQDWLGKSGGNDASHVRQLHENIFIYAKNLYHFKSNRSERPSTKKDFPKVDKQTGVRYYPQGLRQDGNNSEYKGTGNLRYPITAPDGTEVWPDKLDGTLGVWRMKREEYDRRNYDGNQFEFSQRSDGAWEIDEKKWWTETKPVYNDSILDKDEVKATRHGTVLVNKMIGKGKFDYPKPIELLKHLIQFAGGKDAIVLDFFAGTATTSHSVMSLNAQDGGSRQSIAITNNENNICLSATQPRLRAALTGEWADGKKHSALPGRLVFFDVVTVNMLNDDGEPRSDASLVYEMSDKMTGIVSLAENTFDVTDSDEDHVVFNNSVCVSFDPYDSSVCDDYSIVYSDPTNYVNNVRASRQGVARYTDR